MNKIKVIALFLSFLVFFTSSGLTISFHYCGDTLEGWSVFTQVENCNHEEQEAIIEIDSCCKHDTKLEKQDMTMDESCCLTASETILLDTERIELETNIQSDFSFLTIIQTPLINHFSPFIVKPQSNFKHDNLSDYKSISVEQATQCFRI